MIILSFLRGLPSDSSTLRNGITFSSSLVGWDSGNSPQRNLFLLDGTPKYLALYTLEVLPSTDNLKSPVRSKLLAVNSFLMKFLILGTFSSTQYRSIDPFLYFFLAMIFRRAFNNLMPSFLSPLSDLLELENATHGGEPIIISVSGTVFSNSSSDLPHKTLNYVNICYKIKSI